MSIPSINNEYVFTIHAMWAKLNSILNSALNTPKLGMMLLMKKNRSQFHTHQRYNVQKNIENELNQSEFN